MKKRRIAIIQGHPDPKGRHFGHALAAAYAAAARKSGHRTRTITVARLPFPLLKTREDWEAGKAPAGIAAAQRTLAWADHLLIVYPLWLGAMPAVLKGFLEQALRPGFAVPEGNPLTGRKPLAGRSARVVVTMGMPGFFYRWFFGAHSLKSLERNILGFCGIGPIRHCIVGGVAAPERSGRERWLREMQKLGAAGA